MMAELEEQEDAPEVYTPGEVAKMFRVDAKTIARWDKTKKFELFNIQVYRTFGGHRRFSKKDVDRVIKLLNDPAVYRND